VARCIRSPPPLPLAAPDSAVGFPRPIALRSVLGAGPPMRFQRSRHPHQRVALAVFGLYPVLAASQGETAGSAMATGNIVNQRNVRIESEGRTIFGAYTVWSGVLTLSTARGGRKTAHVGSLGSSTGALDGLATIMLRELAEEGKA
jgi:hypothetical protein